MYSPPDILDTQEAGAVEDMAVILPENDKHPAKITEQIYCPLSCNHSKRAN
jgi:hypothetical protein